MIVSPSAISTTATPIDRPLTTCGASTKCSQSNMVPACLDRKRGQKRVQRSGPIATSPATLPTIVNLPPSTLTAYMSCMA